MSDHPDFYVRTATKNGDPIGYVVERFNRGIREWNGGVFTADDGVGFRGARDRAQAFAERLNKPMTPTESHRVCEVSNGETFTITFGEFVEANEFSDFERRLILATLRNGETYHDGGGAAAEWSIKQAHMGE